MKSACPSLQNASRQSQCAGIGFFGAMEIACVRASFDDEHFNCLKRLRFET
jgi:hypothetical protein